MNYSLSKNHASKAFDNAPLTQGIGVMSCDSNIPVTWQKGTPPVVLAGQHIGQAAGSLVFQTSNNNRANGTTAYLRCPIAFCQAAAAPIATDAVINAPYVHAGKPAVLPSGWVTGVNPTANAAPV